MSTEKNAGKVGKIIAVIVVIILAVLAVWVLVFTHVWNYDDTKEHNIKTQYGDEFKISTDNYLGKTTISNSEYRFSYRIQHYIEGDQLTVLCDTPNITCYKISDITICKLKKAHQMIVPGPNTIRDESVYAELQRILSIDDEARKYVDLPKENAGTNKQNKRRE